MQRITLHIPDSSRRTHLFLEVHSVSAVTKFVSTFGPAMSSQTELIFCGIRVILGGEGGGGKVADTRTENKRTCQISGLKTDKIKK